jgi:hypothetical protein
MIKESELRRGNKVLDPYRFEVEVVGIYDGEILVTFEGNEGDYFDYKPDELEGVPLTRDHLKSLKGRVDFVWDGIFGVQILEDKFFAALKDKSGVMFHSFLELKFLHDIQNIYADIMKKEFSVK